MANIYPAGLTEEQNAKLKYPFLPLDQYDEVCRCPHGTTLLIRLSEDKITKEDIARMVKINQESIMERMGK